MSIDRRIESAIQRGEIKVQRFWDKLAETEARESADEAMRLLLSTLNEQQLMVLMSKDPEMFKRLVTRLAGGKNARTIAKQSIY